MKLCTGAAPAAPFPAAKTVPNSNPTQGATRTGCSKGKTGIKGEIIGRAEGPSIIHIFSIFTYLVYSHAK